MAWITVDQKLIGGKLRDFAKRSMISQNEAIGILVRLWLWGVDNAETNGRIIAAEKEDIAEILRPGFSGSERNTAIKVVENLIDTGWINVKDDSLYLHDWVDWRSYYTDIEEKRQKNAEYMRNYRAGRTKEELPVEEEEKPEPTEPEPAQEPEKSTKATRQKKEYAVAFEEFWKVYPRKVDKGNAYKKYQARLNDGYSEEELLTAATNYANHCKKEKTEARYVKHPKTFLSDTMPFTDFLNSGQQTNTPEPQKMFQKGENPFR